MMTFTICSYVNWTQQGVKILLCQYYKIGEFEDVDEAVKFLGKWQGNQVAKKIGRSIIRVGDIFQIDDTFYLYVCKKLVKIPQAISKRLMLND